MLRQRLEAERYQQEQRRYNEEAQGEMEQYYGAPVDEIADVENLDLYLEQLYEEMEDKVGSGFYLHNLAQRPSA